MVCWPCGRRAGGSRGRTPRGGRYACFFFQAEDGIRDIGVTGVQTCALPIYVKAVFCLWGDVVKQNPDMVRDIVAAGHTLCNHTMHHDNLAGWTPDQAFTPEEIRADLEATSALIHEVAPNAPIPYFRAPYGAWGASPQVAADLGMQPLGWRVDITDWETQ